MTPPPVQEPSWVAKVELLNQRLRESGIPYAFGGAIALNYHRDPRSTLDIDINIFLPPDDKTRVIEILEGLYGLPDRQRLLNELADRGQGRSKWGMTFIDIFFADTDFHQSMAARTVREQFDTETIPVLSIEDLLVCKALFNRPKDWIDIEAVAVTTSHEIDSAYIEHWLEYFLDRTDPVFEKLRSILGGR